MKKWDEEEDKKYIEEFNRMHEEFVHGKKEFTGDDYSPFRKKKLIKSKLKSKCNKKGVRKNG